MDIAALSVDMHQASAQNQVNVSIAKKAMDTTRVNGDALVKLMEQSVSPNLGNKINVRV